MPIYKVKDGSSYPVRVNAAYFKTNDNNGWIEFKDASHKLIRAYAPGEVRSVVVEDLSDDKVVLDLTMEPWDWLEDIQDTLGEDAYQDLLATAAERLCPPPGQMVETVGSVGVIGSPANKLVVDLTSSGNEIVEGLRKGLPEDVFSVLVGYAARLSHEAMTSLAKIRPVVGAVSINVKPDKDFRST